jgi:cation:H+ antiporter
MEHLTLWLQFAAVSVVIIVAGARLSRYADVLSEKLKLGHVFVGMVFLGWITSLPELVLSLGSVLCVEPPEPNMAIGNVLGSCLFNLMILVLADLVILGGLLYSRTRRSSAVIGLASLTMLVIASGGLKAGSVGALPLWLAAPGGLHIDLFSWVIVLFYIGLTVFLYRHEKKTESPGAEVPPPPRYESTGIPSIAVMSLIAAVAIVGAGLYMSVLGDRIADRYPIGHTFVGTLFFAVISSLPELSTTFAAVKLGFYDMALGNIFGSNIFNIMIIGVSDMFYTRGSIFSSGGGAGEISPAHFWVGSFAILATVAVVFGIRRRSRRLFWRLSWVSLIVAACYCAGLSISYLF